MHKHKQSREDIDHVHRDDHKPQQGYHPPSHHDPQQGHGEGGFAQGARHDGQGFSNVAQQGDINKIIGILLDNNKVSSQTYSRGDMTHSGVSNEAALELLKCESHPDRDDGLSPILTTAMMMMKSSQPKTRLKTTLTYNLIKTNTSGTMAIVHITPCTVGARLSSR